MTILLGYLICWVENICWHTGRYEVVIRVCNFQETCLSGLTAQPHTIPHSNYNSQISARLIGSDYIASGIRYWVYRASGIGYIITGNKKPQRLGRG